MIVCAKQGCVLPGRYRPVGILPQQPHWGTGESRAALQLCFCTLHKEEATADNLFGPQARRVLDRQFIKDRTMPPDWSRAFVVFQEIDPHDGRELVSLQEVKP